MQNIIFQLLLFAQNARYERGLTIMRWGVTGMGLGLVVAGAGIWFSKAKEGKKELPYAVKTAVASILRLAGLAVMVYAWVSETPF